ncbi:MAG: hypothetical protein U9R34_06210 [Nanoarchaeota archaeon]|nr:hypothetical protein [Nanoarchaeota archaeon]
MAFEFIKKLFAHEPEGIELSPEDVDSWFSEKAKEKEAELQSALDEFRQGFEAEVNETKENIRKLKDAELRNPNIPQREFNYMQGNRIAYMKKAVDLVKSIIIPANIEEILQFHKEFQGKVDYFTSQSYKPFMIVSQFFGNEAENIAANIKKFDKIEKDLLGKYESIGIPKFREISKSIKDHARAKEIIEQIKHNLEEKEKQLEAIKTQIGDADKEIALMNKSTEYKDYHQIEQEKEKMEMQLKMHAQTFTAPFSSIQHPFKKYFKIAMKNTEWIDSYLENPVTALKSDHDLVLLEIFANMEKNIESLKLNEKKAERFKSTIKKFDKEFCLKFINRIKEIEGKIKELENKINSASIINQIEKEEEAARFHKSREKIIQQQIDELKSDLVKIDRDKMMDTIIEEISKLLNLDIKLVK